MADRPTGTVTFLFTDIEGSTRLWEQHPHDMNDALSRHDEVVRGAIETAGGYVFATGGDGFAAAFGSADGASDTSLNIQAELDQAFADGPVPIRVRMGLHTGVAHERDGDYFGTTVNRAARVMQLAAGGQIILSLATHALLDASRFTMVDAGEHHLQGLTRPERLYVLQQGDGLEPSTIRTARRASGNLPTSRSLFIGRHSEVDATIELVRQRQVVTLTGIGGAGKTRLALEVATAVRDEFEHGVWFVDLSAVSDPDEIVGATASALDVALAPGLSPLESLASALSPRDELVVFDNCEHVLDEAAEIVDTVTGAAPGVRFLVTSREGLAIDGEVLRSVAPMGAAPGEDGFELFVSRVRDHDPAFRPEGSAAEKVTELCTRLDGIPLAIELAAARTRTLSTTEVLRALEDRFKLLAGSRRRGIRRHQTMLEAVRWSYDLLDHDEATMLRSLASLVGSFDVADACAVADAGPAGAATLESLAEKSLVRVDRTGEWTRYQLLETVRDFGAEQLRASGETGLVEHRHQEHFVEVVADVAERLGSPYYLDALRDLRLARPNITNAMTLAVDDGNVDAAVSLSAPLAFMAGLPLERPDSGLGLAASALPGIEEHEHGDGALTVALLGAYQRGAFQLAKDIVDRGEMWEDHRQRASANLRSAQCFITWWDSHERAIRFGEAAAQAARDAEDQIMVATALAYTSLAHWIHDRLGEAKRYANEAAHAAGGIASPPVELLTTFALANAHSFDGDQAAIDRYVECLELADYLGQQPISGNCLMHMSLLQDDPALIVRLAAGAIRRHDTEMAAELGVGLVVMARALFIAGRPEDAAQLVAGARRRLPAYFEMPWAVNRVLPIDSELRAALGDRYETEAAAGEALDVRQLVNKSQRLAAEIAGAP